MPPLERRWILGVARHERDALGRTIQYTPPGRWDADSPCQGWRARDVLAHLASLEVAAAARIVDETPAEFEEFLKATGSRHYSVDAFNDYAVAKRRDTPVVSLALEWGRAADLLLARAGNIGEEEWTRKRVLWPVEPASTSTFLQMRVSEWWIHGEDVRAAVGLEARNEHAPIFCVNDLAIRMLGYALDLEGRSFPGRTVRVELDGSGGGVWHRALARGETAAEDREPDAYIDAGARPFALVAARRADPDELLYEGAIRLGGDVELADTVLRALRTFA